MRSLPLSLPERLRLTCMVDNNPVPDMLVFLTFRLNTNKGQHELKILAGPSDDLGAIVLTGFQLQEALDALGWEYLPKQAQRCCKVVPDELLRWLADQVTVTPFSGEIADTSSPNGKPFPLIGSKVVYLTKKKALDTLENLSSIQRTLYVAASDEGNDVNSICSSPAMQIEENRFSIIGLTTSWSSVGFTHRVTFRHLTFVCQNSSF